VNLNPNSEVMSQFSVQAIQQKEYDMQPHFKSMKLHEVEQDNLLDLSDFDKEPLETFADYNKKVEPKKRHPSTKVGKLDTQQR